MTVSLVAVFGIVNEHGTPGAPSTTHGPHWQVRDGVAAAAAAAAATQVMTHV
jgi:hypothetical protein